MKASVFIALIALFVCTYFPTSTEAVDAAACSTSQTAPVQLQAPFSGESAGLELLYVRERHPVPLRVTSSKFALLDDRLGGLRYHGKHYSVQSAVVKSPAEHTLGGSGTRLPVELQVMHQAADGTSLALCVLFRASEKPSHFLGSLLQSASAHTPAALSLVDLFGSQSAQGSSSVRGGYFAYETGKLQQCGLKEDSADADTYVVLTSMKHASSTQIAMLQRLVPSLSKHTRSPVLPVRPVRLSAVQKPLLTKRSSSKKVKMFLQKSSTSTHGHKAVQGTQQQELQKRLAEVTAREAALSQREQREAVREQQQMSTEDSSALVSSSAASIAAPAATAAVPKSDLQVVYASNAVPAVGADDEDAAAVDTSGADHEDAVALAPTEEGGAPNEDSLQTAKADAMGENADNDDLERLQ